ncbi:hypothetical protein BKA69DRAFT_99116 [Paraphysoderma sedebokerense]|nr:hypothetical protein BKA69DRAFT_99116 [Paraphysoderma sedebokerense]
MAILNNFSLWLVLLIGWNHFSTIQSAVLPLTGSEVSWRNPNSVAPAQFQGRHILPPQAARQTHAAPTVQSNRHSSQTRPSFISRPQNAPKKSHIIPQFQTDRTTLPPLTKDPEISIPSDFPPIFDPEFEPPKKPSKQYPIIRALTREYQKFSMSKEAFEELDKPVLWLCDAGTIRFTTSELELSLLYAKFHPFVSSTRKKNQYPHEFKNIENIHFESCQDSSRMLIYPLHKNFERPDMYGNIISTPGAYRVVFNERGVVCGVLQHPSSFDNSFDPCVKASL